MLYPIQMQLVRRILQSGKTVGFALDEWLVCIIMDWKSLIKYE